MHSANHNGSNQDTTDAPSNNGKRSHYITPDYGAAYVPNAGPAHLAPKSLDHFKRGYSERAAQREKEYYSRRHGPTGRERQRNHHPNDRPTRVLGLDINRLADQVSVHLKDPTALFAELDAARETHPEAFQSGRALSTLISVAARRKNIGLGWAAWDYMDHAKLEKNTFHYNSMIAITEKARNFRQAVQLLKEMKDKNVAKNEVTYVPTVFCLHQVLLGASGGCCNSPKPIFVSVSRVRFLHAKNVVNGRQPLISSTRWTRKG